MGYWLDQFARYIRARFREHGTAVSGSRSHQRKAAFGLIEQGDSSGCLPVKSSRWPGVLQATSDASEHRTTIFSGALDPFPMSNLWCIAILGATISGCATSVNTEPVGQPPANYREMAKEYLRKNLFDPYTVRDAEIAAPHWGDSPFLVDPAPGWIICVRMNGKNRMGAYTGLREDTLLVRGDRVSISSESITSAGGSKHFGCRNAKWEPFPELSK